MTSEPISRFEKKLPSHQRSSSDSSSNRRHVRHRSPGELFIEELTPDDMAYDADVETIKPDTYEEAESEAEDERPIPQRFNITWPSLDEELAARMRQLGRDEEKQQEQQQQQQLQTALRSSSIGAGERGRKRRSFEMDVDGDVLGDGSDVGMQTGRTHWLSDLEVQELVDAASVPSPAKRRKETNTIRSRSASGVFRRLDGK